MSKQLETPVALIFFTRPDTLEKVFAEVRKTDWYNSREKEQEEKE